MYICIRVYSTVRTYILCILLASANLLLIEKKYETNKQFFYGEDIQRELNYSNTKFVIK
jgi:hypothetical protein